MGCAVLVEDVEVVPALAEWRLPKEIMIDIFERAAGERANVNASDPVATPGNEMRRWMTRFLRDEPALKALGWVACSYNQIEGIRNDELRIRLVPLNTDARAGMPSKQPVSVSERGPAAEKLIEANSRRREIRLPFGKEFESAADPFRDYDFLYFCTHVSEKSLSAEISRPVGLIDGFVASFSMRVILCQPGEKPGLRRPDGVSEDFAEIDKPAIVRKA